MKYMHLAALSALLVGGIASAQASNLIVNPNFDLNVDGWDADTSGTQFWYDPTQDANGSDASGALAMSTANGTNWNLDVHQCINQVVGGQDFSFGTKIKPNTASVFGMRCAAFASTDCSGEALAVADAVEGNPDKAGWIDFRTDAPFTLPMTAHSVMCSLLAEQPLRSGAQPNGYATAIWADDAFFGPGTTPVSLQSFSID